LARAHALLASKERGGFEARTVTALVWAGRARAANQRDQAFLFYGIALEALLVKKTNHGGVGDRLRLRAAHLVGLTAEAKRVVYDLIGRLYKSRNALVHTGDASSVTENVLSDMVWLVSRAITRVLSDPLFVAMRSDYEFDSWCDRQLLLAGP